MAAVVPFMDELGIDVPAHFDAEAERWVIDCPFPARVRRGGASAGCSTRADLVGRGASTRWKARGPMNEDYVEQLQRGYRSTDELARPS